MPDTTAGARLRAELRRHRDLAGLSGRQLGDRATGISRETVRRFERGDLTLTPPRVEAWLDACSVTDPAERRRLLELAEYALGETRPWSDLLERRGHAQDTAADRERAATQVQSYQPTIWPGPLQTADYARRVLTLLGRTTDVDAAVAARLERQQRLHEPGREWSFLLGEHVLNATLGDPQILSAQVDLARSLNRLGNVDIRVVAATAPVIAGHGFALFTAEAGDRFVTTELVHGEQELAAPEDVAKYDVVWRRLVEACQAL